jgi:hypothetical protein
VPEGRLVVKMMLGLSRVFPCAGSRRPGRGGGWCFAARWGSISTCSFLDRPSAVGAFLTRGLCPPCLIIIIVNGRLCFRLCREAPDL